jgi:hypothetical protein
VKASFVGVVAGSILLAVACSDGDEPTRQSSEAGSGGVGGAAGSGGSSPGGSGGISNGGSSGRGGASGGGAASGRGGATGSGLVFDAAVPDADAAPTDSGPDVTRECFEPNNRFDAAPCTYGACRRGSIVEVSVTSSSGWQVGALFWVLTVCDVEFGVSEYPSGSLDTMVFPIEAADWARLREGDPILMSYGRPQDQGRVVACGELSLDVPPCAP